jgi:hypothetical protein
VNKPPVNAPDLVGWHHGCCCQPGMERRVGKEEEEAPVSVEENNKALVRRFLDEVYNRGNLDKAD